MSRVINPWVWCQVNGYALAVAVMSYYAWITFYDDTRIWSVHNIILSYLLSNVVAYLYVIPLFIRFYNREKYYTEIHERTEARRTLFQHISRCCLRTSINACVIGTLNIMFVTHLFGFRQQFDVQFTGDNFVPFMIECAEKLLLYVMEMFVWEVLFDFGHYWTHRIAHYFKWLYVFGHAKHHENESTDAFDGFNISFDDVFLTGFIPHMFSMFVTTQILFGGRSFSVFEYHVLSSYKAFVEVTGHVGVDFKGHSFPLFPPLPYYLGIDIQTAAYHSLHHRYYTYNYSKRFTLWDRVFGTAKFPPNSCTEINSKTD